MEIPYIVTPRKDTGLFNSKIAIWLFLASEVMLFGGFFSAYVFLRLGADYPWPERTLPVLPGSRRQLVLQEQLTLAPGDYVLDINGDLSGTPVDLAAPFTVAEPATASPEVGG